jgi:hypothetical protein
MRNVALSAKDVRGGSAQKGICFGEISNGSNERGFAHTILANDACDLVLRKI